MAYACPKCGGAVQRGSSAAAQQAAGLVGLLLHAAFTGFDCAKCGPLERAEFPADVRAQMTRNSALMAVGALVLLGALLALLAAVN